MKVSQLHIYEGDFLLRHGKSNKMCISATTKIMIKINFAHVITSGAQMDRMFTLDLRWEHLLFAAQEDKGGTGIRRCAINVFLLN